LPLGLTPHRHTTTHNGQVSGHFVAPPPQKMEGLPTPPNEDVFKNHGQKRQHSSSKTVKAVHRTSKRATTHGHPASPAYDTHSHTSGTDGRHKRVWKACERCRMKKTKVLPLDIQLWQGVRLTGITSAMGSSHARGVRTMAWFVLPALERRWSTSSCQEGMS